MTLSHRRVAQFATTALPPRVTIPVGFGFLAAVVGLIGGTAFGVNVLGEPIIDGNPTRLLVSALIGAGAGWTLGAGIAIVPAARSSPRTTTKQRIAFGSVAIAVLLLGALTAWFEVSIVGPGGLRRTSLGWLQGVTVGVAAVVALTLVFSATGADRRTDSAGPAAGIWARRIGAVGSCLACIVAVLVVVGAVETRTEVRTAVRQAANARTADSLASAAARYQERNGRYPADLQTLLDVGGRVQEGSVVIAASTVPNGYCVRVGTDTGKSPAGPPFSTAVVHPRPPKAHSWTSAESWIGNSCRSEPVSDGIQ